MGPLARDHRRCPHAPNAYHRYHGVIENLPIAYAHGFEVFSLDTGESEFEVGDEWGMSVALSPDNTSLAVCNDQVGVINVWSIARRRLMMTLRSRRSMRWTTPLGMAFDDSGDRLISAAALSTAVWKLAVDERLRCLGPADGVPCCAFSPEGSVLAAGGEDHTLRFWDPETGKLTRSISGFAAKLKSVAFSRDGLLLATGDWGGYVEIREMSSGRLCERLRPFPDECVWSVAFHPDSRLLVACSKGSWRAWDLTTADSRLTVQRSARLDPTSTGSLDPTMAIGFSQDGEYLAGVQQGEDALPDIAVWNWQTRQKLPTPDVALTSVARCFAFAGHHLFFRSRSSGIHEWFLPLDDSSSQINLQHTYRIGTAHLAHVGLQTESSDIEQLASGYIAVSHDGRWLANALRQSVLIWHTPSDHSQLAFALPEDQQFPA